MSIKSAVAAVTLVGVLSCGGDPGGASDERSLTGRWLGSFDGTSGPIYTYTLTLTEGAAGAVTGGVRIQCAAGCDVTGAVSGVRAEWDVSLAWSGVDIGCAPERFTGIVVLYADAPALQGSITSDNTGTQCRYQRGVVLRRQ